MKKQYWKIFLHFGIAVFSLFLVFIILDFILSSITRHGESLTVPDFKGKTVDEVKKICEDNNIRYFIKDSVFEPNLPKFTVVEQKPVPMSKVKEGRRIYITINGGNAPMVKIPDILQNQHRIAIQRLESMGLFSDGNEERRPDLALNAVLEIQYNGRIYEPGMLIPKGTQLHLILGDGMQAPKVSIPDLVGISFEEASFILKSSGLNIGKIEDEDGNVMVIGLPNYEIISQNPSPRKDSEENQISQGESIDIVVKKK